MTSITVCIGDERMQGILPADVTEHDFTAVYNGAGIGTFGVDRTHPAVQYLDQEPAWVEIEHRDGQLFTAFIEETEGPFGDAEDRTRVFAVRDHWCILDDTLAFVAPETPIAPATLAQLGQAVATGSTTAGTVTNQSGYFQWQGADAESAVRDIVSRNLARAGYVFRWASENQHRGANPALPPVRMLSLAEAILPVLKPAGLGIDVWREGGEYVFDIIEPAEYPALLTLDGPLRPGRWKQSRVAATDAYPGGPGDEAARAWAHTPDGAMRARFDRRIERPRDATGFTFEWPDSLSDPFRVPKHYANRPASEVPTAEKERFAAYLQQAGRAALADTVPTSTLSVTLAEDGSFQFNTPGGFRLGERLRMTERLVNGQPDGPVFDDRITSVRIEKPNGGDETVTPVVGGAEQSEADLLWSAISQLAARDRRRATEK